ncbi:hypothetical protein ANCCAN_17377, partial [Ancylostoma caninum]
LGQNLEVNIYIAESLCHQEAVPVIPPVVKGKLYVKGWLNKANSPLVTDKPLPELCYSDTRSSAFTNLLLTM